jgi:hypothetical protein
LIFLGGDTVGAFLWLVASDLSVAAGLQSLHTYCAGCDSSVSLDS